MKFVKGQVRHPRDANYRRHLSEAARRAWANPKIRTKQLDAIRASKLVPEYRNHLSEAARTWQADPDVKARKRAQFYKQLQMNPEFQAKSKAAVGTLEVRRKTSLAAKLRAARPDEKVWRSARMFRCNADPQYRARMAAALNLAIKNDGIRPTRPELQMYTLLERVSPGKWTYTGDWTFLLGRRNPDFTRTDGMQQVVEVYGDYWHHGQNPNDLISEYSKLGWSCIVIWQHELRDDPSGVERRLAEFCGTPVSFDGVRA